MTSPTLVKVAVYHYIEFLQLKLKQFNDVKIKGKDSFKFIKKYKDELKSFQKLAGELK